LYFAGGLPFRQPAQLVSSNGLLNVTFNVEVTDFVVDWLKIRRRSYNSQIPGPTWRIKRDDVVKLHLVRVTRPYALTITFKENCKIVDKRLASKSMRIAIAEFIFGY